MPLIGCPRNNAGQAFLEIWVSLTRKSTPRDPGSRRPRKPRETRHSAFLPHRRSRFSPQPADMTSKVWLGRPYLCSVMNGLDRGGGGGIRTRDTVSRIHTFQACAFSHSATPPEETPLNTSLTGSASCHGRRPHGQLRGRTRANVALLVRKRRLANRVAAVSPSLWSPLEL